jgi:hypothetical protein
MYRHGQGKKPIAVGNSRQHAGGKQLVSKNIKHYDNVLSRRMKSGRKKICQNRTSRCREIAQGGNVAAALAGGVGAHSQGVVEGAVSLSPCPGKGWDGRCDHTVEPSAMH